jgi:hypothetical protein
VLRAAK